MARKKYKTNNLTADQAARAWADYMRLRRRPTKPCWTCKQEFPNTLEHFASGRRGRVGVRCHACVQAHPVPTRAKQQCPCCHQEARLVRDRHAPSVQVVLVCATCLRTINAVLGMNDGALERMEQYVEWRKKAATLPEVTARPNISRLSDEVSPETPG
jgi:hypothetical protein